MKTLLLALVAVFAVGCAPASIVSCRPECRAGFTCVAGACVTQCNPACGTGLVCTARLTCEAPESEALESADVEEAETADGADLDTAEAVPEEEAPVEADAEPEADAPAEAEAEAPSEEAELDDRGAEADMDSRDSAEEAEPSDGEARDAEARDAEEAEMSCADLFQTTTVVKDAPVEFADYADETGVRVTMNCLDDACEMSAWITPMGCPLLPETEEQVSGAFFHQVGPKVRVKSNGGRSEVTFKWRKFKADVIATSICFVRYPGDSTDCTHPTSPLPLPDVGLLNSFWDSEHALIPVVPR